MLSKLQNFRVGTRLSIGFVVIMTLMIGSSVFAVLQVNDVSRTWESFESITLQKRDAIDTASKGLADGVHYFKNYVLRGGEYADKFAQSMANIEKGMESYKRLGAMSDEESLLLEKISKGVADYKAVIDGSVSRLRPVVLAAGTTIFGMIPLLPDAFFASMAVTIMGGLAFASVLTLVAVPVLYALLFRIRPPKRDAQSDGLAATA